MPDDVAAVRTQVARQVAHWRSAVLAIDDLENFASVDAWGRLERYLGQSLRANLRGAVARLSREADVLTAELRAAETAAELEGVRRHVVRFRRQFSYHVATPCASASASRSGFMVVPSVR